LDLFARRWPRSHATWKRVKTYLVAALLTVLSAAVPTGSLAAHAASLNHNTPSASALTLNVYQHPPGTQLTVTGEGFVATGSKVAVSFNNHLMKDSTPTDGKIIAKFKVPVDPAGPYTVSAVQASSGIQEQATFTITPGFESLNPPKGSGTAPEDTLCIEAGLENPPPPIQVQAWGLPASTSYKLEWMNKKNSLIDITVSSGQTTASGTLSTSFQPPPAPDGTYELTVLTYAGPAPTATYYSGVYSCFYTYEYGNGTLSFSWDGVGWDANSTVTFTFDGSVLQQATTDAAGSFGILNFDVACPPPGTYQDVISGSANGPQNWVGEITVDSSCAQQQGVHKVLSKVMLSH